MPGQPIVPAIPVVAATPGQPAIAIVLGEPGVPESKHGSVPQEPQRTNVHIIGKRGSVPQEPQRIIIHLSYPNLWHIQLNMLAVSRQMVLGLFPMVPQPSLHWLVKEEEYKQRRIQTHFLLCFVPVYPHLKIWAYGGRKVSKNSNF
ncbi:unnamed protein product [Cylicostephanus goldi]|uniref:Uncharacterized protein n=1 Tax=Cylicostephanus goldi TaxID=71465 RepID=A0A3P6SCJ3_CYLGO|nr:unnamed protein product [Cylicostephanus goldi]